MVALMRLLLSHSQLLEAPAYGPCSAGRYLSTNGSCVACEPGSYSPDAWPRSACIACALGRVAPQPGSAFCTTCPDGTRSVERVLCELCPVGTTRCAETAMVAFGSPLLFARIDHCLPITRSVSLRASGGATTSASEVCVIPPAEIGKLAAMLDESRELQFAEHWKNASGNLFSANETGKVDAGIEERMFDMHARVQHPFGRRLAGRLYVENSGYMSGPPSTAPQPSHLSPPPSAGNVTQQVGSPASQPPPSAYQANQSAQPPSPAPLTSTAPTSGGPSLAHAVHAWSLNSSSVAAMVALIAAAVGGGSLCIHCCKSYRQRVASLPSRQETLRDDSEYFAAGPSLWYKNALASEDDGEVSA